jgi:monofunctional glycosyltransferase
MKTFWRIALLTILSGLCLQAYFALRIALMAVIAPQSTTFQRSEIARIVKTQGSLPWAQAWVGYDDMGNHIKRAVIASEDAGFADHSGVEWDALEKAWERNARAQQRLQAQQKKAAERYERSVERARKRGRPIPPPPTAMTSAPKVIGGSTITQQLAKNLFLSSERHLLRKGQEFVITFMLEGLLSKERILEIYLNNVEWGEGLFGVDAAAHHYFHAGAAQLSAYQAARLAVMLPAPKRFELNPRSAYVNSRSGTIAARMGAAELP